jgi:hypothetical protein
VVDQPEREGGKEREGRGEGEEGEERGGKKEREGRRRGRRKEERKEEGAEVVIIISFNFANSIYLRQKTNQLKYTQLQILVLKGFYNGGEDGT